jgi:ribose/xylose/arabinose/galactoside ABC-type transport system permease subunit
METLRTDSHDPGARPGVPAASSRLPGIAPLLAGALRPWLVLALVCAGFSLSPAFRDTFWSRDYLPNILQQAATNIVLAVGMTFVVLTGGIDLSAGSVMALCGVGLGMALKGGLPAWMATAMAFPLAIAAAAGVGREAERRGLGPGARWAAIGATVALVVAAGGAGIGRLAAAGLGLGGALVAALGLGLGCGLLNGLVVALGRVPPFVVTLGMLIAARGLTVYATDGSSISGLPPALGTLGQGGALAAITLAVVLSGALLQGRTRTGRFIQAIGANEEAARLSGLAVPLYKTLAYALSGLTAFIAAVLLTAKFQLADTGAGAGAELNAIAAVVIGGTSLSGGRGSVVGSLVGALTIAVLNAGLVLVGVKDTLQGVIIGAVIVVAVMVDQLQRARR